MLWGYLFDTKKWEVHVIDFKDVISRQCGGKYSMYNYIVETIFLKLIPSLFYHMSVKRILFNLSSTQTVFSLTVY